ncbi:MAG TPA: helix-turn-helix domain-containing protein [Kribbella sp.]
MSAVVPSGTALSAHILEAVPSPVWVVDGDGMIAFANPAAVAGLGYRDSRDVIGRPSHETIHHTHPDGSEYARSECPILRPMAAGAPPVVDDSAVQDQWFIRRDGSSFPIDWSCNPLAIGSGGTGLVLTFTDISEYRERNRVRREQEWSELRANHPRPSGLGGRTALLDEMRRFVADNVTDPALDPARVANAHHVSIRLLQALFADIGCSPARYIRELRLARARAMLRLGEPVARAGHLSGFADPGTFTRAFRRRYGCTPSEFVDLIAH